MRRLPSGRCSCRSTCDVSQIVSRKCTAQPLCRSFPRKRSMITFALHHSSPVFPVTRHFGQNVTHDLSASHQAVLFALEDTDLALAHELAQPSHVVYGYARVFATVMDDHGAIDVFVAEADGLLGFQADDEIGCWIRVRCCAIPDGEGEALIESALAFAFG